MNSRLITAVFLSIAAIILVVYFLSQRNADRIESGSDENMQQSQHLVETQSPSTAPTRPPGEQNRDINLVSEAIVSEADETDAAQLAIVKHIYNADSALAMVQALDELAVQDPDYVDMRLRELSVFCHPEIIEHAGNASVQSEKKRFCADFDHTAHANPTPLNAAASIDDSSDEDIDALVEYLAHRGERQSRNPMSRFESEHKTAIEAVPEANRSDRITELLRNARFPLEVLALGGYLQAPGQQSRSQWKLGEGLHQSMYPEANLVNAQEIALHLYGCRRFGGCGSNQFLTISMCSTVFSGKCRPGTTLEEVFYQTTPPADFNLAMAIQARL